MYLSESYEECLYQITDAVEKNLFESYDSNGVLWKPVDFQCVNWNGKKA